MTIEQTVEIPANRRLHLDLEIPREIPVGKAQFELKVIPFVKQADKAPNNKKLRFSKQELDAILQDAQTPHTDALTGLLSHLGDITIEEIRDERLAKHLS